MWRTKRIGRFAFFLIVLFTSLTAAPFPAKKVWAKYAEQTVELHPGWNAVFLEVEPLDRSPAAVFEGIPVESVWRWNPPEATVQYIEDPDDLAPEDPRWAAWFPPDFEYADHLTGLHAIFGELPYLIKLAGESDVQWTVTGVAKLPSISWKPQSMNLVGFHLKPGDEPSFADFFAPSDAHGGTLPTVYGLDENGDWRSIAPASSMKSGEAYWVKCDYASDYTGPVSVSAPLDFGLDFGKTATRQALTLLNHAARDVTLTVSALSSSSNGPATDGMVPLSYWVRPPDRNAGWNDLNAPVDFVCDAGRERDIRFAVRRVDIPSPGVYQSVLEIDDHAGMRILVPVVTGESQDEGTGFRAARASEPSDGPPTRTGLWIGTATIDHVNEPARGDDPSTPDVNEQEMPRPTDSEFDFRLMLHVDETGNIRMLRELIQLMKPEKTDENGDVVEEARVVLITDNALLDDPEYIGVGLRDGRPAGRRFSTPAFSFDNPLDCTGTFEPGNLVAASYTIGFDDPLNPYKHKYHPDHDNLDRDFGSQRPEAFEIVRSIALAFTETDPTNLDLSTPGWGDTDMGGEYLEEIQGLHKEKLFLKGFFRLTKISDVGVLNDGSN